ncbi:DEAD/DEAH box helicase family protein [Microbacterium sp.]|uniref:DEAD/DEAH box helicase family protein n=1 Tax=Microbacterium sp. TaxID=51671 RepID=UPI0028A89EEE|nr:DEAD/DEAH box helicase family protein [Microbacterium sp.]
MTRLKGLRSINFATRYRSDMEDVVASFYLPAFSTASVYKRAVGYFSSTSLALYSRGLEEFGKRGGRMQLIASPNLNGDDIADIERGYELRAVIARAALRELTDEQPDTLLDGLGQLGRFVAEGRLDIKLAFVEREGRVGIYHEKLGIFRDHLGDVVGFTGSGNETLGGLLANFESVEVYPGWHDGDGERALRLENDFGMLWANQTPGLSVEAFPDVVRERLIEIGQHRPAGRLEASEHALTPRVVETAPAELHIPSWLEPRDYQKQAVESWLANRGRGILKMATGTGKTKTAMIAATQLSQVLRRREEPLVVLIIAPLQHLVDQWISEVEGFGVRPVGVYESSATWLPIVEEQLAAARLGRRPIVALVATNSSFAGDRFQSVLKRLSLPMLVIGDEAHNLGSAAYRGSLPENAAYRLALSATPERWFDDEGTDALIDYFGDVVYELDMGRAIQMKALTRYHYQPRLVELDYAETQFYVDLTAQIATRMAMGSDPEKPDSDATLGFLLRQRAGILGHAAGKLAAVRRDVAARRDAHFQLIYCAEGSRPASAGEEPGPNQLQDVLRVVGRDLGLAAHQYTSETPRTERKALLRRFATGTDLQALVAMRCLDEGVDIPDARIGYLLASSSNPRQFIQRRGRLLRLATGKRHAEIVDYLAVPPSDAPVDFDVERRLLIRELERTNEFARLSENYGDTLTALRPLKERYQLMDM